MNVEKEIDLALDGAESHPAGAPVYAIVEMPRPATYDARASEAALVLRKEVPIGDHLQIVHVISRWAGGEIRGYIIHKDRAFVRYPASPREWPELDRVVEKTLGVRVIALPATGGWR